MQLIKGGCSAKTRNGNAANSKQKFAGQKKQRPPGRGSLKSWPDKPSKLSVGALGFCYSTFHLLPTEIAMVDSDMVALGAILLIVWWFLASAAVSKAAGQRGHNNATWFFLALFLGPIFAVLLLIAHPIRGGSNEANTPDGLSIAPTSS